MSLNTLLHCLLSTRVARQLPMAQKDITITDSINSERDLFGHQVKRLKHHTYIIPTRTLGMTIVIMKIMVRVVLDR